MNSQELHSILYQGAKKLSDYYCIYCDEEKKEGFSTRLHFHGSDVGKCKRAIYYDMHKKKNVNSDNGREALFLNMGHRYEEILATALKRSLIFRNVVSNDGISDLTVFSKKEVLISPSSQQYIDVMICGHFDIQIDNILLEIKAVGKNSFNNVFLKKDLSQRKQYYGQVQFYLSCLEYVDKAFLVGISRETCEIAEPIEIKKDFDFMKNVYQDYAKILYYGVFKDQLPTRDHDNLNDYECRFCSYYVYCKDNKKATEFEV